MSTVISSGVNTGGRSHCKEMTGKTIDWQKINRNLPYAKTPAQLARRRGLWRAMDVNDNGFLSLAEVTRGVRDVLALQEIFNCRPAVNAAFHHCRDIHKVKVSQFEITSH